MSGQSKKKTYIGAHLADVGKKLYLNAKTADVHFSFDLGNGMVKRIAAHKNILAATSDVFEAMFYGNLKEKGDVRITDASEAAFMEFLQFFYLDRVTLTMENIGEVMYLGNKYNVPNCINACIAFLKDVVSVDNIFIGLHHAIHYDQRELLKFCETIIILNTVEVIQSTGFLECDQHALAYILNMNVLSCSEVEIFKACMAWARVKSKQNTLSKAMVKKHLGDLYYEIRFKSMTVQELCSLQMEYEPVLRSDFATITNMIASPEFQAEKFNNEPRHAKWNAGAIVKCDQKRNNNSTAYVLNNKNTTTFSTNKPLLLGSFVCGKVQFENGPHKQDLKSDLPVDVQISEVSNSSDPNAKVLLTMRTTLQSKDYNNILLPHPILIRPKFLYKICIGTFPAQYIHYSAELKESVYLSYDSTIVEFHDLMAGRIDKKVIGLISCLNFNPL